MLGPLDKSFMVGGGGWWHCNYSFKLQGSRGDLESLSLVELDSRSKESNSWTHISNPPVLEEGPPFRIFGTPLLPSDIFIVSHSVWKGMGS